MYLVQRIAFMLIIIESIIKSYRYDTNYLIALTRYSSYITFMEARARLKILKAPPVYIYGRVIHSW